MELIVLFFGGPGAVWGQDRRKALAEVLDHFGGLGILWKAYWRQVGSGTVFGQAHWRRLSLAPSWPWNGVSGALTAPSWPWNGVVGALASSWPQKCFSEVLGNFNGVNIDF